MKKFALALPLSLVLASAALAAGGLTVTNNSGLPIDELTVAATGTKDFGTNLMDGIGEGALDNGKTVEIASLADGTYDFKVSAPDEGILCTIPAVAVQGGKVELTPDHGKACK